MKVWVKAYSTDDHGLVPANINISNAFYGFNQLGVQTILYENIDDILDWVTREDIVVSYIGDVRKALNKFDVNPYDLDYPKEFQYFYKREVRRVTYRELLNILENGPLFIKPVEQKAFTGLVVNNRYELGRLGRFPEEFEFFISEPIEMLREWRIYVKYTDIVDIRPYDLNNNFYVNYDSKQLEKIVEIIRNSDFLPAAYSVDIAQCSDGELRIVEVNDGFSLASYGMQQLEYAKFLSARWSELLDRRDFCLF